MKKFFCFLIMSCIFLSMSGCDDVSNRIETRSTDSEISMTTQMDSGLQTTQSVPTTIESTTETTQVKPKNYYKIRYDRYKRVNSYFSENLAWVYYEEGPYTRGGLALIDDQFRIIESFDTNDIGFINLSTKKYEDGVSAIYGGYSSSMCQGLITVDKEGHFLFDSRNYKDGEYFYYLGYGDEVFVALENITGFSANEWYICEINSDGVIEKKTRIEDYEWDKQTIKLAYYGDGIFCCKFDIFNDVIYNKKTGAFFVTSHLKSQLSSDTSLYGSFDDGGVYAVSGSFITSGDLQNESTCDEWYNTRGETIFFTDGFAGDEPFGEGVGYSCFDVKGYYNSDGELVVPIPEEWDVCFAGAFSGGYAALSLYGSDGNKYFTVIDKNGNPQYAPKKGTVDVRAWHGYLICDGYIYDPHGNVVQDWNTIGNEFSIGGYYDMDYRIGYFIVGGGYTIVIDNNQYIYYLDTYGNKVDTVWD